MGSAVGILEVYGLVTAFAAADAACKAASVTVEAFDRNKPANAERLPVPLIIVVKLRGKLSDIQAAVSAGEAAANAQAGVISTYIIPHPDEGIERMLQINALG